MGSKNTSITLGDHYVAFAEAKVKEGRYASTSEVIRAGLRLLEAEERKLEALRGALIDGENSGFSDDFDFEAFLADMNRKHRRSA